MGEGWVLQIVMCWHWTLFIRVQRLNHDVYSLVFTMDLLFDTQDDAHNTCFLL